MQAYLWPLLFTVFVWWFTTGVIIYLDGLARKTFKWTIAGMTALLAVALFGIAEVAQTTTASAAYLGFTFGLIAWGWQEVTFLTGAITGPRKTPCPPDATGFRRVRYAIAAILWHELATLAVGGIIVLITWDQPNQIALWTYVRIVGDAPKRKAQRVPGRSQSVGRIPARPHALSGQLFPPPADERTVSVFSYLFNAGGRRSGPHSICG